MVLAFVMAWLSRFKAAADAILGTTTKAATQTTAIAIGASTYVYFLVRDARVRDFGDPRDSGVTGEFQFDFAFLHSFTASLESAFHSRQNAARPR